MKRGLVRCLYDRAEKIIPSSAHLSKEKKHLRRVLNTNGYPNRFINRSTAPHSQRHSEESKTPAATISIPFVSGISEDIRRVCGKYDVRVSFRAGKTLRSVLTRVKDPLPLEKQSMVVYQVPCSCGLVYIGKTIRRLETRLKEHKDACSKGQTEKSAIAEHAWEHGHAIKWDDTLVLDHAKRHQELLLKEALHIRTTAKNRNFNRDQGIELHECWTATITKCEGRGQTARRLPRQE